MKYLFVQTRCGPSFQILFKWKLNYGLHYESEGEVQ